MAPFLDARRLARNLRDPMLLRFRDAIGRELGPLLDAVVLFGPRAMGHDGDDLPWEVAIFVAEDRPTMAESLARATRVATAGTGQHLAPVLVGPDRLGKGGPLLEHLALHGIPL
jgi:hypothetical protein